MHYFMRLSSVCGSMLTCGSQCGDTATCITLDFYIFRVQKIYQWVHYSKPHQNFFIIFYLKKTQNDKACILKKLFKNPVGLLVFFSPIHYICIKAANIYLNKQYLYSDKWLMKSYYQQIFRKPKSKKKKRRTPFRGRELCMMKATCNRCGSYTTVLH